MAKVLVVDDDSHFRRILERVILRSYTYSVISAATEEEAWELLSKTPHDLVLLDVFINGKKSWNTLRRIHALPDPPRVIVVSCEDTKENAQHARILGAFDFIPKPIDFARLKATVDAALGSKRGARPARRIGDPGGKTGSLKDMRVLIVAGRPPDRRGIAGPLEKAGFQTIEGEDARTVLEMIRNEPVDAVLVGFLGDRDRAGDTCRTIRQEMTGPRRFPMIAVPDSDPETILLSLESGADDFITMPFDARILAGKVEAHVRRRREYDLRMEELVGLCVRDALTGSYNHAYFKARLAEEYHRSRRYKRNLALAILGLNNLEKVRAEFGPSAEDRILVDTSQVIRGAIRSSDVVARSGEAEFSLIFPEATSDRILSKADVVRSSVQERVSVFDARKTGVICSVGLASVENVPPGGTRPDRAKSAEDLLGMASMALTRARGSGNGRVEVFGG